MTVWIGLIAVFCYVSMHLIETASFGSRAAGRLSKNFALGTTVHYSLYTGSRFLLIFFLPSLGFLVESGIDFKSYFLIVIFSLFLSFAFSYLILIKFNQIQSFFQRVFFYYKDSSIPIAFINATLSRNITQFAAKDLSERFSFRSVVLKKVLIAFSAYCFLSSGFFISFLLALEFIEYRLTLSQFTAAFHGIGAIIVSFYLDPMLSKSIDEVEDESLWMWDLFSIVYGRMLAYLATSIIFLSIYLLFY